MLRRVGIIAGFVLPLAALLWGIFVLRIGNPGDGYVLRLALPDGSRAIGLPPVEGPADASRPLVVIDAGHGGHDPRERRGHLARKDRDAGPRLALRDALLPMAACAWR
jgi:N-acetylmuramoyl-L-alanine amidase